MEKLNRFFELADVWISAPGDRQAAQSLIDEIRRIRNAEKEKNIVEARNREIKAPFVDVCEHVRTVALEKLGPGFAFDLIRGVISWSTSGGQGYRIDRAVVEMERFGWRVGRARVGRRVVGVVRCSDCAL